MENYYTKFIAVDSQIEEGDIFQIINEHAPGGPSRRILSWGNTSAIDVTPVNDDIIKVHKKNAKKVKMFLCSKEVPNIGDTVYLENSYNYSSKVIDKIGGSDRDIILEKMPSQRGNGTLDYREMIKILGEVSEDALFFVKEGDEYHPYKTFPLHVEHDENGKEVLIDKNGNRVETPIWIIEASDGKMY